MNAQEDPGFVPDPTSLHRVTELLARHRHGDANAIERLVDVVYPLLLRLARNRRRRSASPPTFVTTEIANEVYLRFFTREIPASVQDRATLTRALVRATQNLVVELYRHKHALKRGGGATARELEGLELAQGFDVVDQVALHDALSRLRSEHDLGSRYYDVVTMRYYLGMTVEEVADILQVSARTVDYDWTYSRAVLARDLRPCADVESWDDPG